MATIQQALDAADAISVSSESVAPMTPRDKDTCSAEHGAVHKEHQVLAHLTSATLERLHVPARLRPWR